MAAPDEVVNLDEKFSAFDEKWSPKIVGEFNDTQLKAVKVQGEFVWHTHEDADEFFVVRSRVLTIQMRDREDVTIGPGSSSSCREASSTVRGPRTNARSCFSSLLVSSTPGKWRNSDLTAGEEWI